MNPEGTTPSGYPETIVIKCPEYYRIDFSKCHTMSDLTTVLNAVQFHISSDNPNFETIKRFLVKEGQ